MILSIIILVIILNILVFLVKQPLVTQHNFKFTLEAKTDEIILKKHVKYLSETNRTTKKGQEKVINYILNELENNGIKKKNITIQTYEIDDREYKNIIVSFEESNGKKPVNKYILGAHYDAFGGLSGADDNASGVAGLLEVSRVLKTQTTINKRNIDLVFYSTEEPPFYGTENMGSFFHAKSVKDNHLIKLVIIYDMIGYFSEEKNSQDYPISFMKSIYPKTGNYISLVSNFSNLSNIRKVKSRFSSYLSGNKFIGVQSINAPTFIQGIDFSDHRNYWKFDFPSFLITDTAFYRNKNYHTKDDTYEKLNYIKMKEVVDATIITLLSL